MARVTQVSVVGAGRVAARGLGTSAGVSMLLMCGALPVVAR
ncbi:hypothetical protein BN2537_9115 [Streptomyces venezuelae]|nr:hypothetical protein BN2537_9115 [Streptomyces venezuelae]